MRQKLVPWDRLKSLFFYEKILHALKALKPGKAEKHNQAKAQNANKRISDFVALRYFSHAFFNFCSL